MDDLLTMGTSRGTTARTARSPLANRLRPRTLDEIVGQDQAIGPDTPIGRRLRRGEIGTLILHGPPGTGKTSIAQVIGATTRRTFRALHPSEAGATEIKAIAREARGSDIVLLLDEINRFGAVALDHLLGHAETGLFSLIGTTGSDPRTLPDALASRSLAARLEPLGADAVETSLLRGEAALRADGQAVLLTPTQRRAIATRCGGDARRALNILDLMRDDRRPTFVKDADLDDALEKTIVTAAPEDASEAATTHALIEAIRACEPDEALHWLATLMVGGTDPRRIARRLMVLASEDVGLADNTVLATATAAQTAVATIGLPEAGTILAHAVLHAALAPKSRSAHEAMRLAREGLARADAGMKGAKPETGRIRPGAFYRDGSQGEATYEGRACERLARLRGRPFPSWDRGFGGKRPA